MPDVFTKKKRSEVMSRIRSRGNRDTELAMMRVLRALGITGWRRHVALSLQERSTSNAEHRTLKKKQRGKDAVQSSNLNVQRSTFATLRVRPDFVFRERKVALFVDGCFWHACPIHSTKPRGNAAFWREKFARNQARDRLVTRLLKAKGWKVLRIWEHELAVKQRAKLERKLRRALDVQH